MVSDDEAFAWKAPEPARPTDAAIAAAYRAGHAAGGGNQPPIAPSEWALLSEQWLRGWSDGSAAGAWKRLIDRG